MENTESTFNSDEERTLASATLESTQLSTSTQLTSIPTSLIQDDDEEKVQQQRAITTAQNLEESPLPAELSQLQLSSSTASASDPPKLNYPELIEKYHLEDRDLPLDQLIVGMYRKPRAEGILKIESSVRSCSPNRKLDRAGCLEEKGPFLVLKSGTGKYHIIEGTHRCTVFKQM